MKHTPEEIAEWFVYNPDDGSIRLRKQRHWRGARGVTEPGMFATKTRVDGYLRLTHDGVDYLGHRIAWVLAYGEWPRDQIDHINGDRADNRLANLRDVKPAVNSQNRRSADRDNLVGLLGVSENGRKFKAAIKAGGVIRHLGTFETPQLAHSAYVAAKRQFHEGNTL